MKLCKIIEFLEFTFNIKFCGLFLNLILIDIIREFMSKMNEEYWLLSHRLSTPAKKQQRRLPDKSLLKVIASTEQLQALNFVQCLTTSPSCTSTTKGQNSKFTVFPQSGIPFTATHAIGELFEFFLEARPYKMQFGPSTPSFSSRILKHHQILNTNPKYLLIVGFRITEARQDTITMFTACRQGQISKIEYSFSSREDVLKVMAAMPPVAIKTYHSVMGFLPREIFLCTNFTFNEIVQTLVTAAEEPYPQANNPIINVRILFDSDTPAEMSNNEDRRQDIGSQLLSFTRTLSNRSKYQSTINEQLAIFYKNIQKCKRENSQTLQVKFFQGNFIYPDLETNEYADFMEEGHLYVSELDTLKQCLTKTYPIIKSSQIFG